MREIRTSGLMSGEGKRGDAETAQATAPLLDSTRLLAEAVAAGRFHIWSVTRVEDAIELFMGTPAGEPGQDGTYPPDSVFGQVTTELEAFDRILSERER